MLTCCFGKWWTQGGQKLDSKSFLSSWFVFAFRCGKLLEGSSPHTLLYLPASVSTSLWNWKDRRRRRIYQIRATMTKLSDRGQHTHWRIQLAVNLVKQDPLSRPEAIILQDKYSKSDMLLFIKTSISNHMWTYRMLHIRFKLSLQTDIILAVMFCLCANPASLLQYGN